MSEVDNAPDAGDVDPIKNVKAEMNRKFQNLSETNQKLAQQNEALNAKIDLLLNTVSQPKQESSSEDDEALRYTDPDAYIEKKLKDVDKKVDAKIAQTEQMNSAKQQTLIALATDYPEINDPSSALYKKAIELGSSYPANFVSSPEGIRLIVREAAADIGLLPKKSRQVSSEEGDDDMAEFIGGGGSGNKPPSGPKNKDKLDPKTLAVAELMGLNVNDPKVVERLKERSKRNYNKYR